MEEPKLLDSQIVYEGYFNVQIDTLQKIDGSTHSYTQFCTGSDAVVVLAMSPDGKYLLNREYRHPIRSYILGLPGGRLESGEDPLEGGHRELLEETGYSSSYLSLLGISHPMPALCDQKVYFLLARDVKKTALQNLDPIEVIQPTLLSESEIKQELKNGAILDGHLLAALALARFHFT